VRIAINQPYFVPARSWFRLIEQTDLFVVLDCVQHIRRGWVHRNRLRDINGALQWLTLPIAPAPQKTPIHRMSFAADAAGRMEDQLSRFPAIKRLPEDLRAELARVGGSLSTYLVGLIESCCDHLGIKFRCVYSSALNLPDELRGQDRILAICERLDATEYLNSPGGRALYQPEEFSKRGVKLEFLPDWQGSYDSVLEQIGAA
jgi:hypothetical protein